MRIRLFASIRDGMRTEQRVFCRSCGRRFWSWNGTSNHGLMHVRKGEASCESDPHCPATSGHRYLFWLRS